MVARMRLRLFFGLLAGATIVFAQTQGPVKSTPQFSLDERSQIMEYWSQPGRYIITTPPDAQAKGLWQVRLTVKGSTWLQAYNRARKVSAPPTENAQPANEQQRDWETWVVAKLARDRWEALQAAQDANEKVLGQRIPASDKTISATEPPRPGPIPDALFALAGNPPKFAEAVVPMERDIVFEDITLTYQDNIRLSNPRYAYYRFSQGVNSEGVAVKEMPQERLDHLFQLAGVSDSEAKIMKSVSLLEGGFDAINTYDTGYVSIGFIQFASLKEGAGSLGTFLLDYKNTSPDDFQRDLRRFGVDVTPSGVLDVLDLQTGAELTGTDAALKIIEDPRLVAAFQRAGLKSDNFIAAQIRSAKAQFYPGDDNVNITVKSQILSGKVSDFIKSEAGMATLMDRKVNTGKLDPFNSVVTDVANQANISSISDLASHEMEIIVRMKYRKSYLDDSSLTQPSGQTSRLGRKRNLRSRGGNNM